MEVMSSLTYYTFSILLLNLILSCTGSVRLSSTVLENNAVNGNRKKFRIDLSDEQQSGNPALDQISRRFRRYLKASEDASKIKENSYYFNDNHFVAEVHWSGKNSSSIMVLMKDPSSLMSPSKPSHFFISRNYGQSYENVTHNFLLSNGTMAVISDFFSSKSDNRKYILVAKFHRTLFISNDECKTFYQVRTFFYPTQIKYHPHFSYYVAAYEGKMGSKRLYTSTNNGRSWVFKSSDVENYAWGYHQPSDLSSYIFYLKNSAYSKGIVVKSRAWRSYYFRSIISYVNDFQLVNQYIFVTKNGTTIPGTQDLYISVDRQKFNKAVFPFTDNPEFDKKSLSFLVADATENETLIAVSHGNSTANLYISDKDGKRFSLSLESILYSNSVDGKRKYFKHDFVDLHRVIGVSGVYIATNLTKGKPGTRHLQSWITFDKGGTWSYIKAPPGSCSKGSKDCTLHLSQEFGFHNPSTRFSPIYSRTSAPGFILGTGSVGTSLKATAKVFLSTDAGLSWKKVLDGHYHYAFVDHGGIIVGVKKYGYINTLTYSWDEGHSWHDYQFSKTDRFRVYGLLTEPGEKTTIFTLFASKPGGHSWVIIQVDFKDFLGRECQKKDYYLWELSDPRNDTEHCALGKKQKFERRLPDVKCLNGYEYERAINSSNCLCAKEDYMCDFGFKEFVLGWFGKFCFPDINYANFTRTEPPSCKPGRLYNVSSGYRKVPGDTCEGGEYEKNYLPDTRACKIPELKEFIFYAKSTYIVRYDTQNRKSIRIDLNGMKNVISLDYDYKENTLFYADVTLDRIVRMNMSSGHLHEVIQFDDRRRYVEGIAYDWMNKDIYFTDVGSAEIGIVSINGRFKKTLFGPEKVIKPRGIAVHPKKGLMFWTDLGKKAIYRADMNGKNMKVLVQSSIDRPNDVTVDYEKDYLYWADSGSDRLERVDLNGNNRKLIMTRLNKPYSLDILKDRLFWDDWSYGGIQSVLKDNGEEKKSHVTWLYKPSAIRAFWDGKQTTAGNPCAGKQCPFKCLPAGGSYDCVCPDGLLKNSTSGICLCPGNEVFDRITGDCKPRSNETCLGSQFTCEQTGECIAGNWKCDGDMDCSDGTDEKDCQTGKKCRSNQFKCKDGACILSSWKCDGEKDCADGSDEIGCSAVTCAPNYVKCPSTVCISNKWICDGEPDCDDGWDEESCAKNITTIRPTITCPVNQFSCVSSRRQKCFPNSYKCDASVDCDDGSDENNCHKVICKANQFACSDGLECIPKQKHCNQWNDCTDHSDERNCSYHTTLGPNICGPGTKPCDGGRRCYSDAEQCDGHKDCNDGADEKFCSYSTPLPLTKKPCEYKCKTGGRCGKRCNGIPECPHFEDEIGCPPPTDNCALPEPFVHKCGRLCLNITKLCDYTSDCIDSSDELDCEKTGRVTNFQVMTQTSHSIKVSWRPPDKSLNYRHVIGYKVAYMNLADAGKRNSPKFIITRGLETTIKNLVECNRYVVAVGLHLDTIDKINTIYVEKTIEIGGWREPLNEFPVVVNRDSIAWKEESGPCVKQFVDQLTSRRLRCLKQPSKTDLEGTFYYDVDIALENPGSLSEPYNYFREGKNLTANSYQCRIDIGYKGGALTIKSQKFFYPTVTRPVPAKQSSGKSKQSTLIWAIPVAIVVLALFLGLAVMVYKYRRLQHSFLAFAARGNYTRQEDDLDEDDDNMVVGFHAGEDQPMINRFSDDEPLVVA